MDFVLPIPLIVEGGPMGVIDILSLVMLAALWLLVLYVIIKYGILPKLVQMDVPKKKSLRSWIEDNLLKMFLWVWGCGFVVYFVGTCVVPKSIGEGLLTVLSAVPMAIIHATEMFIAQSDISAIHGDRHESFWYMTLFDTIHFFAVLVSLLFVIKHFGFFLNSRFKLKREESNNKIFDSLYIFWNVNEESLALAKSISDARKDDNYHIVFINTPTDENYGDQRLSFSRFFGFVSLRDKQLEQLEEIPNTYYISSYHKISELPTDSEVDADILCERLHLQSLAKMIDRTMDPENEGSELGVHIFFIGEERDDNINSTINIIHDKRIRSKYVNIYCQARSNAKTQWMNHYYLLHPEQRTHINVVDTASLSVMQLKMEPQFHPVNYVKFDKNTGTIVCDSKFSSAVIGFGETGLESLRFLYEFGTFIDAQGKRQDGGYFVTDENMKSLKGVFYSKSPALKDDKEIELCDYAIGSERFWDAMEDKLPELNYIVIAVGDDNLGMNTAIDCCTLARKLRPKEEENLPANERKKLTIFVRSYEEGNYRRLNKARRDLNESCKDFNISIELFGSVEQIFTYDLIIASKIIKEAKIYNYMYEKGVMPLSQKEEDACWYKILGIKTESDKCYTLTDFDEIERKRNQNISNSLHRYTKVHILKFCNEEMNVAAEIKQNVAKLEHERWIANSKLKGWDRCPTDRRKKDLRRKYHCDICNWDEIRSWDVNEQKTTQEYDLKVVDTSIMLEKHI